MNYMGHQLKATIIMSKVEEWPALDSAPVTRRHRRQPARFVVPQTTTETSCPTRFLLILRMETSEETPAEILELAAIVYDNDSRTEINEFHEYIKPVRHPMLSEATAKSTGVRQEQVDGTPEFEVVWKRFAVWMAQHNYDSSVTLVSYGTDVLQRVLPLQLDMCGTRPVWPGYMRRWVNIQDVCLDHTGFTGGLSQMMRQLRVARVEESGQGMDTCRHIAALAHALLESGAGWRFITRVPARYSGTL